MPSIPGGFSGYPRSSREADLQTRRVLDRIASTFVAQAANRFLAGPASGADAAPTFRAIVAADLGTGTANSTKFLRGDLTWQTFTTGTVTSVAMTVPTSVLSVSGSPITTSGTLAVSLATQQPNRVWAGPSSAGAPAPPIFRALVAADLGTGTADATKFLRGDLTWQVFTTGTVTSVAMTVPSILSVSGSPITTSGTLAVTLANQGTNLVFAGPNGGAPAAPTFRSLAAPDLATGVADASTFLRGDLTWATAVRSVALTVPSFLSVSGSPVTTLGTLAVTLATQPQNKIFAGPTTGADAAPTFRTLVAADLGTGTASSSTFLRGDLTWASVSTNLVYSNTSVPAGNTVVNTTTETAFSSSYTFAANSLAAGMVVRITARGVYSTNSSIETIRIRVKLGSTTILDTGVYIPIKVSTNQLWELDASLIVFTAGGSGTVDSQGCFSVHKVEYGSLGYDAPMQNTSPATIDTTASQALTITVEWGAALAGNSITLRQLFVETLR
jgi:hypothetical protein